MGKYTKEMHERYREEQEQQRKQEQQRRQEASEKASALKLWLNDGGDERSFAAAWPKMRDAERARRVVAADHQARRAMRNSGVSHI